jgi:response regulator RpfG family c-di-GMP phosphodiesterase
MSLADCYDALTTRRSYKEPWTHADAAEHIRAQSGAQFDPEIVAVFAELETRFDEIRQRLADAS